MLDRSRFAMYVGLTLALSVWSVAADCQTRTFEGVAVTGINRLAGRPVFDTGPGTGTIGFETVGAFVPGAATAGPLTESSPTGTLLATVADPLFLTVFNAPAPDPSLLNIPLRKIAVYRDPDGTRAPLRGHLATSPLEPSRVANTPPITFGQWLAAEGTAKIRCTAAGKRTVEIRFRHLIPHGLYSVWAAWKSAAGIYPIPMGGAPNAFVADERGTARFERTLSYCPFESLPGGEQVSFIEVIYHSDLALTAGVPELFLAGFPPGVGANSQLDFPIAATLLP